MREKSAANKEKLAELDDKIGELNLNLQILADNFRKIARL